MFNPEPESIGPALGSPDPIKAGINGTELRDGMRSLSNLEFGAESALLEQLMPVVVVESELLLASGLLGAASVDKPPEVGKDLLTGETEEPTAGETDALTGGSSDRSKIETRARQRDFAGNSRGKAYNIGELTETEAFGDAVSKSDRRDLYKFRVKEKTDVAIALDELDGNADLFLLNNKGKVLEKSVKGGKQPEQITMELEPGVYYGEVRSKRSATANYEITFEGEPTEALPGAGLQARNSNGTNWDVSSIGNLTGGTYYKSDSVSVDKQDWHQFALKKRSDVKIELSGLSGNADLYLYDYKKNKWIESSQNPGSSSEAISYDLKSGNYAIAVWTTDWWSIDYDLEINATPEFPSAGTLRGSKFFKGNVSKSDGFDYYKFTLDESKEVDISLSGLNDNANLELGKAQNKKFKTIISSKRSGSNDEGVSWLLGKGTYYVRVRTATKSENTDYDLVIGEKPLQSVGVLTGTKSFSDSVDKRDPYDFYVFKLEENTDISINLSGLNDNADLYLFENALKKKDLVARSTKSGSSSEAINKSLSAGTYIAMVRYKGGSDTDYNLSWEPKVTTRTDSEPGIPYVFGNLGTQDDTLWEIAQRELKNGNRWGEIMKEDGSTYTDEEARYIKAGTIVYLPNEGGGYTEQSVVTGMRTITEEDYQAIAARLNIDIAAIKAVQEVESSGGGFLKSGKPTILFEAHQFSYFTGGKYDRDYPSISSPYPESRQYYKGGEAEYARIEAAMTLDREAALQSASWGAFQIMGFNYNAAGFNNVEDFVNAMKRSATDQLNAFISFVEFNDLAQYIRNKDWAGFARRYNGPDYRYNRYDERLRNAYEKYSA